MPLAQPVEHHRGRQEHGGGIGLALSGDIGRGAVARLEHRMVVADVGRRRKAHAADQPGAEIRQDVAEHVLGHHHVEVPRPDDQRQRGRVDIDVAGRDVGKRLCPLVEDLAEEGEGLEHVGLVDAGYLARAPALAALFGEAEGEVEQALAGRPGDHHGVAGNLVVLDGAAPVRGEQAFGRFADQHEVDVAGARACQRMRHAGDGADGAHAGIEAELHAQVELRRDLGAVGIADVRQPHGAEQDGVGLAARLEGVGRQGLAGTLIGAGTHLDMLIVERTRTGPVQRGVDDLEAGRHDLLPDAVARQHRDAELRIGVSHVPLSPVS
jgi:hypothetical protein